jgi:hypothetical protein
VNLCAYAACVCVVCVHWGTFIWKFCSGQTLVPDLVCGGGGVGGMSGHGGGGSIEQTSHRNQQDCRLFELHIFSMNLMSFLSCYCMSTCLELVHLPLYFLFYFVDFIKIDP